MGSNIISRGFHSHGGTPIAGWFISWKSRFKKMISGCPGCPPFSEKKPIGDRKSMKILKMFTVLSFYMSFFSGKYGHTMDPWTIHREVTMDTTFFTITSHHLSPDPKERAEDPTVSHQRRSKSAVDVLPSNLRILGTPAM